MKRKYPILASKEVSRIAASQDIEDCCLEYAQHTTNYHLFTDAEVPKLRADLLEWYGKHRRKLPWRGDPPPYNSELQDNGTTTSVGKKDSRRKHKMKSGSHQKTMDNFLVKKEKKQAIPSTKNNLDFKDEEKVIPNSMQGEKASVSSYGTWVSEVMLQQTQVDTVINYYNKWMETFPTLEALAAASLEEVNSVWAGLGYYSRARRLHEGAQFVLKEMNGQIPSDPEELLKIPGIGPYTAGAIASISFNRNAPLVDGNVIRVFSRLRAINNTANNSSMVKTCWDLAKQAVDPEMPGDFNQGLMELGATICTPQNPSCQSCPVKGLCKARSMVEAFGKNKENTFLKRFSERNISSTPRFCGESQLEISEGLCNICIRQNDEQFSPPDDVTQFPRKKEKKAKPVEVYAVSAITVHLKGGKPSYLLLKRPNAGLLAGQWELPSLLLERPGEEGLGSHREELAAFFEKKFGLGLFESGKYECKDIGTVNHIFSHKKHEMRVQQIIVDSTDLIQKCIDDQEMEWMDAKRMRSVGLTTNMKKVLDKLK